jgi:ankyrin repeat protein
MRNSKKRTSTPTGRVPLHRGYTKAIARTLLRSAIKSRDVAMVRLLLDTGISLDSPTDYSGMRLLEIAILHGSTEVVQPLPDRGALVNWPSGTHSPNYLTTTVRATAGLDLEPNLVPLLLNYGAHGNVLPNALLEKTTLATAAEKAAGRGLVEIMQLILKARAVQLAAYHNSTEAAKILTKSGANINAAPLDSNSSLN